MKCSRKKSYQHEIEVLYCLYPYCDSNEFKLSYAAFCKQWLTKFYALLFTLILLFHERPFGRWPSDLVLHLRTYLYSSVQKIHWDMCKYSVLEQWNHVDIGLHSDMADQQLHIHSQAHIHYSLGSLHSQWCSSGNILWKWRK